MTLTEKTLERIKELGPGAPAYFGKAERTVQTWIKTGRPPVDVIERVHAESQVAQPARKNAFGATDDPNPPQPDRETPNSVVPPRPDQPQPEQESDSTVLRKHQAALQQIVDYMNGTITPWVDESKKKQAETDAAIERHTAKLESLDRDITHAYDAFNKQAPVGNGATLGQVLATDPDRFQQSRVRPQGQVLGEYREIVGAHPLDSGIAPTREQVEHQNMVRASGGDPSITGTHRPAGPAVPLPPEAQAVGPTGWNVPIREPARR